MNFLLVTFDQFRGDCLSAAGHPVVRTPNLDRLVADGVRFGRHYSQSAPCAPGRAALYTGMYQMNNRVVGNGTPLDHRFDNVARAARRAGYRPALFGYTDQGIDPRHADGPDDPRLSDYEGVLPGFDAALELKGYPLAWIEWLERLGYDDVRGGEVALETEPLRPAEHGVTAYLAGELLDWIDRQESPWFAHASFIRPHPPYAAAGAWSSAYSPDDVEPAIAPGENLTELHQLIRQLPPLAAPVDEREQRELRAQYYGMVSAVDEQFGRIRAHLESIGQWDDTFVVVTSDHGEQLCNHGLIQKMAFFEDSYHVVNIVRDPRPEAIRGVVVDDFTENVDIMPTLCDALGLPVPVQCDGLPLTPFLRGERPERWRDAAHWEFDWRSDVLPLGEWPWPWDRRLERMNLATIRTNDTAYVHFGDGTWRCFDLAADPTWRTEVTDPTRVLDHAQQLLTWRAQHADRIMPSLVLRNGGMGRWPADPAMLEVAVKSQA
jgi:arylsulfatase A-like enzyme